MARYFFHLHNDIEAEDPEGVELPDLAAARKWAMRSARDLAAASLVEHGRIVRSHRIDVADQSGAVVLTVRFGDVVAVED